MIASSSRCISFAGALLIAGLAGCSGTSLEPVGELLPPDAMSALISSPFSHNIEIEVPAGSAVAIHLVASQNLTGGIGSMMVAVKAESAQDVVVGFAVRLRHGDAERITFHGMGVPGDNATWATRFFGSLAGETGGPPDETVVVLSARADATFYAGLVHPQDWEKRYRATEEMSARHSRPIRPDATGAAFSAGTAWHIQDAEGEQMWRAGDLAYSILPTTGGDEVTWSFQHAGPAAAETLHYRPAGEVHWTADIGGEQHEGRYTYAPGGAHIAMAVLAGAVPVIEPADADWPCFTCDAGMLHGTFTTTGVTSAPDQVEATIVIASELPAVAWAQFGWPPPTEWAAIGQGTGGIDAILPL